MAQTPTKKTKRRRIKGPVLRAISFVVIAVSCFMIYGVAREVMNTMELKNQLDDVKQRLETIQAENEQLTSQQEKLQDPNYVQSYARGNYMLSKEGEQIFYLPSEGSNDEDADASPESDSE